MLNSELQLWTKPNGSPTQCQFDLQKNEHHFILHDHIMQSYPCLHHLSFFSHQLALPPSLRPSLPPSVPPSLYFPYPQDNVACKNWQLINKLSCVHYLNKYSSNVQPTLTWGKGEIKNICLYVGNQLVLSGIVVCKQYLQ